MPAWIVLGSETQRRFLFGDSYLLSLVPRNYFRSDLHWNFPAGTSELIVFGARLDRLWDLQSPEIPSRGFLLVFPRWGLPWFFVREELHFPRWGFTVLFLSWGTTRPTRCNTYLILLNLRYLQGLHHHSWRQSRRGLQKPLRWNKNIHKRRTGFWGTIQPSGSNRYWITSLLKVHWTGRSSGWVFAQGKPQPLGQGSGGSKTSPHK